MNDTPRITPDDIEAKFDELAGEIDDAADNSRDTAKKAAVVGLLVLIVLAFLLGRRRGAQSKTVVEIRRL
ncbi:MAG: hypothetical protein RIE08_11455 [Acidimicrobiales bacterium]